MNRLFSATAVALVLCMSAAGFARAQELPGVPFGDSLTVPPVMPVPPAGGWPVFDGASYLQMQNMQRQQLDQQIKAAQNLWLEFHKYQALAQQLQGLSAGDWANAKVLMSGLADAIDNTQTLTLNQQRLSDAWGQLYPLYRSPQNFDQDWTVLQYLMQQAGANLATSVDRQIKANTRASSAAAEANANIETATRSKNQLAVLQTTAKMSVAQYLAISNLSNLVAQNANMQNVYLHNSQQQAQQTHNQAQAAAKFFGDGQSALRNAGNAGANGIDARLYTLLNVNPASVNAGLVPRP